MLFLESAGSHRTTHAGQTWRTRLVSWDRSGQIAVRSLARPVERGYTATHGSSVVSPRCDTPLAPGTSVTSIPLYFAHAACRIPGQEQSKCQRRADVAQPGPPLETLGRMPPHVFLWFPRMRTEPVGRYVESEPLSPCAPLATESGRGPPPVRLADLALPIWMRPGIWLFIPLAPGDEFGAFIPWRSWPIARFAACHSVACAPNQSCLFYLLGHGVLPGAVSTALFGLGLLLATVGNALAARLASSPAVACALRRPGARDELVQSARTTMLWLGPGMAATWALVAAYLAVPVLQAEPGLAREAARCFCVTALPMVVAVVAAAPTNLALHTLAHREVRTAREQTDAYQSLSISDSASCPRVYTVPCA